MNRLILVGNGFDLAHGLKTSYKDFIIGYLADCFYKVDPYRFDYNDELLSVNVSHSIAFKDFIRRYIVGQSTSFFLEKNEILSFFELCYEQGFLWGLFSINDLDTDNNKKKESFHLQVTSVLGIQINCDFFKRVISSCIECNWVDIESEYFKQLKKCKNKDDSFNVEKVQELNKEFDYLKEKLEVYLQQHQVNREIEVIPELLEGIKSDFEISDFEPLMGYEDARLKLGYDKTKMPEIEHNLYFLNFNYTNTLTKYKEELEKNRGKFSGIEVNHIHGELGNRINPIIFGFGDEHDKEYLTFEEQSNNDLFTHIKSYQYFKTANYRKLANFLNSDNYQVFVMGHSCGLSDRTMFKEIFDHENCNSVKIFYYQKPDGTNDFLEKTINLGRHFSNKGRMRKLIVEFDKNNAFSQSV